MKKTNSALKLYIKFTIWCTSILTALALVFVPLVPAVMSVLNVESIFGMDVQFSGEMEKSYLNVLLMGLDKDETRTDVMMVAQLNLLDNSVNILQIPRDTYIENQKGDKKINSAYGAGGPKNSVKTVEKLLGIEIDNYAIVTTSGFRDVVDAVGGIYYDVPRDMKYTDPLQGLYIDLKAGPQMLDGDKAEQYVRFRHGYANADLGRIEAQSGFIKEAIKQIIERNLKNEVSDTQKLITSVAKMVDTDFEMTEMLKYAPSLLSINTDEINIMMLQGRAGMKNRISYYFYDEKKAKQMIDEYFTPDISEADFSELEARDEVAALAVDRHPIESYEDIEGGFNVYVMDYSGTEGERLSEVTQKLSDVGCKVVDSVIAMTATSDTTYCIGDANSKASESVAKALSLDEYYTNPEHLNDSADVVLILGKEE